VLRAEVDAIAVGSGTMLADDPRLTARGVYRSRPLVRVIFDRRLRTPAAARVFATLEAGPVIILADPGAPDEAARALESAGARVVAAPGGLADALRLLVPMGVQSLLAEGGPTVHASLWREHAADAVRLVVAPRALGETGVPWMEHAVAPWASWRVVSVQPCGGDVIIEADVYWTD
jgi:diaminohydroxyphosphoribosylaminopyrimidine deaminase/5-amino-6-(5-phosphoribosylamino)uracil reductase